MELEITLPGRRAVSRWRDTVAPKEHGSWSLAFEPLVLALLVAPSAPGAFLALSLAAAFFARRPLRIVRVEQRPERSAAAWQALAWCAGIALSAFAGAVVIGGLGWLGWLLPLVVASGIFAWFDLRGAGREEFCADSHFAGIRRASRMGEVQRSQGRGCHVGFQRRHPRHLLRPHSRRWRGISLL